MYKIDFSKEAEDNLKKLDNPIKERIMKKIKLLEENPRFGVQLSANLAGLWKLRVGDYRVIYEIRNNELRVLIIKIGHRKNVYE